jgi:hypothetical protein
MKTIPFTISIKIKYLRVHLTKKVKGLHTKNHKVLVKEIGDDTNK